jgi:DNA-directed RNA polymerase specialized sigma24 family protein
VTGTTTAFRHTRRALETTPRPEDGARTFALVRRHRRAIHSLALDLLGDADLARDVTTRTLGEVYQRLPELVDRDRGVPWTRLYQLAAERVFDAVRSRDELLVVDGVLEAASADAAALRELSLRARRHLVSDAVARLDPRMQVVSRLRYVERLPHRTIDAWLGETCSVGLLDRARDPLRRIVPDLLDPFLGRTAGLGNLSLVA